jgi:response regulator of citrate/malate metabolism
MFPKINCVLLIDDEGASIFTNYRIIKSINLTENIQTELNGEGALIFIQNYCESNDGCAPELILLDIKTPDMSGFDFLAEFKKLSFKNKDRMQMVVLTASVNPEDIEKMRALGLSCFIIKPLTSEKLHQIIGNNPSQGVASPA